jgi:multiple sugar transport system ATP-binding protein
MWFGDELVTSPEQGIFKMPQKREVAMVFQDYAIYPHMTVFGNIAFPLEIRKINKKEIEERVKTAARLLEIEDLLKRKPKALSGGQRQRIALARAMVRSPKVFLLDEPLANLDAKLRVHARVELKELQRRLGVTAIFVTHDQVEAMTIGDRIAVMNNGRLEQMGTPAELYHHPSNRFVAGFIGSPAMNMMNGTLQQKDGSLVLNLACGTYEPPDRVKEILKESTSLEVTLGIRPESVVINGQYKKNALEATVVYIELIGKEYNIHLNASGTTLIAIREFAEDLNIGVKLWLTFDEKKLHIFDLKSGEALLSENRIRS